MNPSQSSSQPSEVSYHAMDTGDVEAIGAHCQYEYCNQLDFLPFRCDSCHSTFCLDHRSETSHKCTHAGEWARNRRKNSVGTPSTNSFTSSKPTLQTGTQCSDPHCKTFIHTLQNTGVHCATCNRDYCLKHRMREDHNCTNLTPIGARPFDATLQTNKDKLKLGFGRLKAWSKTQGDTIKSASQTKSAASRAAQISALNALKRSAKGDDKLPVEKRVYLHVEAEAATTTSKIPKAGLFFSQDWSVGRLLDDAAKRLQVANVNNRVETEEQRLRVYHVEGGRLLEFSEKVGKVVVNGNTVVLLRGVGPVEV